MDDLSYTPAYNAWGETYATGNKIKAKMRLYLGLQNMTFDKKKTFTNART